MKAADIMRRKLVMISPEATAREAFELMRAHDHAALPVVDEQRRLVGIVTEADLLRLALPRYLDALGDVSFLPAEFEPYKRAIDRVRDVRVREFMSRKDAPVADENDSIVEVARIICELQVRRVPIVRDGRLVGLITRKDLMREIVEPAVTGEGRPSGKS
ncbi:MAG: HPP family protein [Armatimonadota bacterium]